MTHTLRGGIAHLRRRAQRLEGTWPFPFATEEFFWWLHNSLCAYREDWPRIHSAVKRAHDTDTTGALSPAPCGTKAVSWIRTMDPA